MTQEKQKKFIILDANALIHRAFHALPPLTDKEGHVVNALYGFAMVFLKILRELNPDYIAVAFDRKEPTFRHKIYKEYKAKREKQPQELYDQFPWIKEMLEILNIRIFEKAGYEADDLIAVLCKKSARTQNIIITGDLDTLQLVNRQTQVLAFKKGITEKLIYTEKEVKERFGLKPAELIDYKALRGDPSDNILGVRGIGEKTAKDLISEFGSLENIYRHLESCKTKIKCKIRESTAELLTQGKEAAFQSKELVTLVSDAPIEFELKNCQYKGFDSARLFDFFQKFGFKSLLKQLGEVKGAPIESEEDAGKRDFNKYQLVDTEDKLKKFLLELKKQKVFAFNVEIDKATLFGNLFSGITFNWGQNLYLVKFSSGQIDARLKPIFEDKDVKKIGYDFKSQMDFLNQQGINLCGLEFDAMIAAYLLDPGMRNYALETLVFNYLGKELKRESKIYFFEKNKFIWQLYLKLGKELENNGLLPLFNNIEMPLIPILFWMEKSGIKIDIKFLEKLSKESEDKKIKTENKIYKLAGEKFNINSPRQLKEIIFEKLKLKPKIGRLRHIKTGLSTAASELEKLKGVHPIIDLISEFRELAKLKSTYIDALPKLVNDRGRIHTTFNQTVTATGRLSSSDPNLQNIPVRTSFGQKIRQTFIAEKGFKLVAADYSQIELRLAAILAGEDCMIDAFNKSQDIHRQTAAEIWNIALAEVDDTMRSRAKTINFGVLYGMGSRALAEAADISFDEAEEFINKYFEVHPKIREYTERTIALARKVGYAETFFGRRRYIPEIASGIPQVRAAAERTAINMPIQGTAADLMKLAMIKIDEQILSKYRHLDFKEMPARMLVQVHDELVFEIRNDLISNLAPQIKEIMETVYKFKVPILVDVKAGENWQELQPL